MAEAVSERPLRTKTKAKKPKVKSGSSAETVALRTETGSDTSSIKTCGTFVTGTHPQKDEAVSSCQDSISHPIPVVGNKTGVHGDSELPSSVVEDSAFLNADLETGVPSLEEEPEVSLSEELQESLNVQDGQQSIAIEETESGSLLLDQSPDSMTQPVPDRHVSSSLDAAGAAGTVDIEQTASENAAETVCEGDVLCTVHQHLDVCADQESEPNVSTRFDTVIPPVLEIEGLFPASDDSPITRASASEPSLESVSQTVSQALQQQTTESDSRPLESLAAQNEFPVAAFEPAEISPKRQATESDSEAVGADHEPPVVVSEPTEITSHPLAGEASRLPEGPPSAPVETTFSVPAPHHLYPRVPVPEVASESSRFKPMSIEQLQTLYYNPELQINSQFIEQFVQNEEKRSSHEFHEILMNYRRSRKSLRSVEEDLKSLRQNYEQVQAELWVITSKTVAVEGQCADGSKVNKVHTYEQCELNRDALANMTSTLLSIRNEMQGDLALFAYSAQMSRLQVESYLHQLFMSCPHFRDMPKNSPVVATDHLKEDLLPQVEKLKNCISVLFVFHRKPTQDTEFVDNIRKWTGRLVAALLRVASYADHLFLLNHILRAPSGVGRWAAGFVQIPAPASLALQTTLGSAVLDHAVTCLATVMLPVKAREEFMCQMRQNESEPSLQTDRAWILVDSDGEEDEDPSQAWLYLHENDIVAILQQLPLEAIFAHLLQAPVDDSGVVHYDVRRCTEPTMMKLFAFCTTWISLIGAGLETYSMARYRQLNKRLGRLIRQTVAFVSDHWLNFKTYYGQLASAASLERLQMEFDQLFMRATYTILTAQKLGSWQFMADMPFTCLSAGSVWRLLWLLQQNQSQAVNLDTLPPVEKCKEDMKDLESRRQLADTLQKLPTSESIFLLTTFANMAASRPLEEDEFIECITLQVFEIAYICDHTRDFCKKTGRELLSSVIQKHPVALSMLLRRVQVMMSHLGMMALYLFHELPASIWIPKDPDMLLLRQWLLNTDLSAAENQLSRTVLESMNWDLFSETGKLVLDIRLHRQVALLLVESYVKFISERRASFLIVEGMKQMASLISQQGSREQQFNNWAWALALRLKLHRESAILHSKAAESQPFQAPSLEQEPWLLPLSSAARAKNPLACFLVLSMTDVGHDTMQFLSAGLDMLMTLATSSQYSAVIHVLSCVTPQFLSAPLYLLENETFQKVLQMVLSADENVLRVTKMVLGAEFPGTVTRQFTQMIQAMISARLGTPLAVSALIFWTKAIFKVARFLVDQNCCYVLDHLVRWGYLQKGARDKLDEAFRDYFKQHLSESKSHGGLLSLFGSGSVGQPSLMERASLPEFGWLATQILHVEGAVEMESGIWPSLQYDLLADPSVSVETALKHVVMRLKPESAPVPTRLAICRWAQQALDMPVDHSLLPIVWQRFFSLYLGRPAINMQLPTRASVGERFFRTMSWSSVQKKMKKKLAVAADFHMKAAEFKLQAKALEPPLSQAEAQSGTEMDSPLTSPVTEESPRYTSSGEFHQQLARLYQTYSLWLEEPRLHGADLYLPALPPQYEAARLNHIFCAANTPWLEFVDFDGAQYEISVFAAEWRKLVSCPPQLRSSSPARRAFKMGQRTATERILERLQRFPGQETAPSLHPVTAPVPDVPTALLYDRMATIHLLDADLNVLTEFTKVFSKRAAQQCAIDAAYLDLIPKQWANVAKQAQVAVECRSRVNPLHRCSGPAAIVARVEEREVNPIIQRKMDENRAEYKQLLIEADLPPPQNVCISAVHVENAITLLIKMAQGMADEERRAKLVDLACTLFFHLTVKVSEETNFYPPTKQFFASCVEILGQEFVSRVPEQTPLLLQFCLDNPSLAGMVSPHFVPNNAPLNFVSMYEQLITVLQQQDLSLVFMLLTKFDVWAWLEEDHPQAADKKRFLEVLGSALMSCGAEPTPETKLVFDLYLAHLKCMLRHQFPVNLSSVLILLLHGSSSEELHTSCWEMLLMECCCPPSGPGDRPTSPLFSTELIGACNDIPLSTQEVQQMLRWLGAWFMHQRVTQEDTVSFGLYPRWGRYVPYISLLMGLLSRSFVAKVLVSMQEHDPFEAMQVVWQEQLRLWQAWLEPLPPPNTSTPVGVIADTMLQPWTEGDNTVAVTMVEMFKSTLLFTHTTLAKTAPQFSSTVFSFLLMHYLTKLSQRSTPPYISDVLVAEFAQLPWEQLRLDLQLLETMAQLKEQCATSCFQLIGYIIPKVAWPDVLAHFRTHQDPQVARSMQASLLLLLIQCYGDTYLQELPEVVQLLTDCETFDWTGLTVEAYRRASCWFLQVCQPQWALAQRSSVPALGFRLMKKAAEFTPDAGSVWSVEMSVKRLTFVHCVTQQLCQVTYMPDPDLEALQTVLVNLLSEIESVESAVVDVRCQEEESLDLMKHVLGLLNNSNPQGASQGVILQTLQHWLHSSPHSILLMPCIKAASRCLASLRQMALITETCIQVYFIANKKDQTREENSSASPAQASAQAVDGWTHILAVFQVPELNLKQYVKEALSSGAYLMLYTLLLHKRPLCQSLQDEALIMEEVLEWTAHITPSAEDEAKLLLWWHEFLLLWLRQLDYGENVSFAVNAVQRLITVLHQLGEDRATTGFLGVIGFGKRSQLSLQFRLAVRTIAAFLSSQVLSETSLRFQPSDAVSELPLAKQSRLSLTSLRSNKMYAPLKESVESMLGFVHRTDNTVRNVLDLVKELARTLYPQCDFLVATFR